MDKKQLKIIFNKNIVKDKSFIKMVCFTIVLLLVLVLGSNFGYVSAEEIEEEEIVFNYGSFSGTNSFNYTDYSNSSIYDSSVDYFSNSSTNINVKFINFLNDYSIPQSGYYMNNVGGNDRDMDLVGGDYYYVVFGDGSTNYDLYLVPSACFVVGGSVYLPYDDSTWYFHLRFQYDSSNDTFVSRSVSGHDKSAQLLVDWNNQVSHSSGFSYNYLDTYNYMVFATCPIYYSANNTGYGISDVASFLNSGGNNFKDVNYFLYDSSFGYDSGTGGTFGEDYSNNMYVDYADWILNNYTGDIWNNYRNVSVSFTSNLNDYIREHYNDTDYDNYSIWLDYNVYIDFYYQTVIDYGNLGGGVTLGSEFASVSIDYNHDMVFTDNYHWSCNYVFTPSSADSSYISTGYLLPMDTFIEDKNCVFTLGLDGLFAYLSPSDGSGNLIGSNGTRVHTNLTLSQLMTLVKDDAIVWSSSKDGLSQFKMTCTAKIIYDDFSGDGYSGSGTYIETFNLLDGTSTVDSNNMLTNYNPYITNTSEDVTSSLPSTSTTGTSVATSSTGNVTQTVTVSNEGAKYIPSIISSLIPSSFGDTTTGLASRFTTLVDSNNFITVMANTVPAIPTTVWTYLTEYLGISLYLLACAFVLRLILDLL